ncbi:MAG TPA: carboxypeptidase regulatory-like domain-containing protein [Flavisolibacter sp.]|nr:carboxypeptidase regulatory-like domain-containing protein [Flavisolibacter sp.]
MRLRSVLLFFGILFMSVASAQALKLSGKVVNEKNETLPAVSVKLNTGAGTTTNVDGGFSLTLNAGIKYQLTFTAIGYADKTVSDVEVLNGQPNELNIVLATSSKDLGNVVVTARASNARRETINSMIAFQKNTNTVAQVVSAEAIRRSPDRNTGEILKRVPGTSIQEGKYLVVRGLADRYNQAMLNGILLSSTEPDRKTFSFDIFPAPMIENIVINKAFVPEFPGEWAGGLVQVNTKDVPSRGFLNVQIGTNFNTQTINHDFFTYKGGNNDWLGYDDGTRALPGNFPHKSDFNLLNQQEKTAIGKNFENVWSTQKNSSNFLPVLGRAFQLNGGFNQSLGGKNRLGGILAVTYNRSFRRLNYNNSFFSIQDNTASLNFDYNNDKYSQDVLAGALGNLTLQLGNHNKIAWKNILNVNTSDYVINRTGKDFEADPVNGENIRATELAFKANTFFNTQLSGEHNLPSVKTKLRWYGSFSILDQYIPDQRRIQYNQATAGGPYALLISNTRSQKSGSRYYGFLNDYVYTAGGDLTKNFTWLNRSQSVKAGYMFQVKDRLFDSRPFSIYLSTDNPALRQLPAGQVFAPGNFGTGTDNKFGFDELSGSQFRYLANTILNAGFIQLDNQFTDQLRAVWGVRVEDFDQVVGSMNAEDSRHIHSHVRDFLPALNLTYKINPKTNLRLAGSQTVIRPEFRELSTFAFFDFELGATILGNTGLRRTKVSNLDLRYELYPRAGERFTLGVFYKNFKDPIELYFNQSGVGTSNTFNFINADLARSVGAELEFRKKLDFSAGLKNFTVQGNLSYIYNRVKKENAQLNRPMQGQSPYLINAGIQYDLEKLGLSTTLLFNEIGRRILYVGNQDVPSIWEAPRPLSDLTIAKKIMHNRGELKVTLTDFLNRRAYFYHDLDDNGKYKIKSPDALAINRRYGSNVGISFSYNIK